MKFKITLKIDRKHGDLLPFNYQYEQSAVIYRILAKLIRNIRHGFMKMAIYYMKERGLSYFVIHPSSLRK